MTQNDADNISFEVETSRILEILTKEIYDSPHALLRENLQNAYDAVLMLSEQTGLSISEQRIDINIDSANITIRDSGIGMTEEVLRKNFWKAGSSGKHTDLAKRAGVIGTFGIGAMANFGVCLTLRVETRAVDTSETLISTAKRDELKIGENCISLEKVSDERKPGTILIAELDPGFSINEGTAYNYLEPYVRHVPVAVFLNDKLISQQPLDGAFEKIGRNSEKVSEQELQAPPFSANVEIHIDSTARILAKVRNVKINNDEVSGELMLVQDGGQLMAYRSSFGLAPAPVSGFYSFGGIANLSFLTPTAGREALGRESIQQVQQIITQIELIATKVISELPDADRNLSFLNHVSSQNLTALAKNVTVEMLSDDKPIKMAEIKERAGDRLIHYYGGHDQQTLQMHSSTESCLLILARSNPRRVVQERYLSQQLGITSVPDTVSIRKRFTPGELTRSEVSFVVKVASVLASDYLLPEVDVCLAEITHAVQFKIEKTHNKIELLIARSMPAIPTVLQCYDTAYEFFAPFVKDFIRIHIYPLIAPHVPSSTKQGADALFTILQKNRELYRIELDDKSDMEALITDWLEGEKSLSNIIQSRRPQTQKVTSNQVGVIENELPGIESAPASETSPNIFDPVPAIMRDQIETPSKMLIVSKKLSQLNNFTLFLSLSDRLFNRERDFFQRPHTTKVMWGGHRITYIFADPTHSISLYYDIELKNPLEQLAPSGEILATTTLYTKKRIFVPVPDQIVFALQVEKDAKEFYVRFDTIP